MLQLQKFFFSMKLEGRVFLKFVNNFHTLAIMLCNFGLPNA
jgi:hypothetical protein